MTTIHRANDPLLQPYQLKHLTLRNRFMSTSHEPNFHDHGMPKDRYIRYHEEKAKGGIALTMTAGSAVVSRDSSPVFGNLHAYKDEIVPWLKRMADACHEHGSACMIQLTHLGRRTVWNGADWLPVVSPSNIREPAHRAFPKIMEDWDMDRIVRDYADAAERVKEAGLDGFELECYGHLLDSFWSPAINNREDEHGGSLDNRLRFTHRVLEAIRDRVGPDYIVGLRLVADEDMENGISRDEGLEICRRMIATGHIDFLNIIRGHIEHDGPLSRVIPVTGMASAPHLDFAGQVRMETKFPVFHAARITDVATARHAVAEGKLDMVGMTRAHIADPHIARKVAEGREDEVRPCVGATYCLDRIYEGRGATCIHNAATGREASMPHTISGTTGKQRHVVVVGAGPAGLEASRVSAERGHRVTLLEAAPHAGGQIRLAAQVKRRSELIGIVDWRLAQLQRLGVEVRYNTYAEASDIIALNPDVVIVATGGLPREDAIAEGAELATSSWDVISGDASISEDVLLFDDNGAHPGMAATEVIMARGAKLEVVTPERMFAPEIGGLNLVPYIEKLQNHGAVITTMTRVQSLRREGNKIAAVFTSPYNAAQLGERLVDQVVVEYATSPMDELYFALKPDSSNGGEVDYEALVAGQRQQVVRNDAASFQLFRIGDAVAARNIHAGIYDALRLCKDL